MAGIIHKTVPVKVWVDIDEGIAECVRYLNTIPGVRTYASCQGTIGEGGPEPYRGQVGCTWPDSADAKIRAEFNLTFFGDSERDSAGLFWAYVHPR